MNHVDVHINSALAVHVLCDHVASSSEISIPNDCCLVSSIVIDTNNGYS